MTTHLAYQTAHNHIVTKLLKQTVVRNIDRWCKVKHAKALVYYKTDPFTPLFQHTHKHTNIWEIACLVRVLNQFGFVVDLVDRSAPSSYVPEDKYDLFIGLGADDSGQRFNEFAQATPRATKVLLATGAHPDVRNQKIAKRSQQLTNRRGVSLPMHRRVKLTNINKNLNAADMIWSIGNNTTIATYQQRTSKPITRIYPSTPPDLILDQQTLEQKNPKKFIFFSGTGNLLKGIDILIEVFANLPSLELHLCTIVEPETKQLYAQELTAANIHIEGFVKINSPRFNQLTAEAGHTILPSCSEGTATSITTCMRRGCIPIVTPEAGIDVGTFGYLIDDVSIPAVQQLLQKITSSSFKEFEQRTLDTFIASYSYTQEAHERSITSAVFQMLSLKRQS